MLPTMPVRPRRRRLVTLCGALTVSAVSVAAATLCACGGSGGGEKGSGDAGGQGMANVAPTPIEDAKAAGGRAPSLIGAKRLAGPFADLSALCGAKKLHTTNEGYDPAAEDAAERRQLPTKLHDNLPKSETPSPSSSLTNQTMMSHAYRMTRLSMHVRLIVQPRSTGCNHGLVKRCFL